MNNDVPTEKRVLNREHRVLARAIARTGGHCPQRAWSVLLLAIFVFAGAWRTNAALTLTPATGGAAISADTAGGIYTSLTGPKLAESRRGQIGTGSIILNAPSGFMFNTGNPVTVTTTGIVLSNTTATVTATTITIGVKTKSTKKATMTWAGIQVRPATGTPLATGNLTNSGSSAGPAKPGNWGTLKEVAGAVATLAFGTQPSSVSYDFPITPAVTVKIFDQYGNIVSNSTTSVTMAIGNNPSGGTLSGTLTVNAVNGTATFSTLSINKPGNGYTLTATATGLTGITSSSFDINLYRYVVASGSWTNTASWSGTSGGAPGASVPTNGVSVFMGEAANAYTVTIPSGYGAACGSLTMGNLAGNNASALNFSNASSSLTVNGNVSMNRPASGATTTIGLGAGSLTVNGNLGLANHTNSNTANNLLNTITISTGTLTVGGNLIFSAEQALQSQIVFSGAGTLNLAGAFTLSNSLGTLTPGTGTVNFNGSTAGQTIPIGVSAVTYSNLTINNTSPSGATPGAAITGTQVTGNLSVQSGTFNNGGFAITLASAKNFSVATDATFNLNGTSTMVTVSGGGTKNFAATSTVDYAGTSQTVTAEAYGNLTLSGSGTKTMPASTISIAGNFTLADGSSVNATAGAAINTLGDFTLGANTTFNAGTFTHSVGGDWINNGATFNPGTGVIVLNGTNGFQNLWGTSDNTTFTNLIVNNSAGVTLGADATVNGTLTLSNGILTTASDQVNVLNTANTAITGAGSSSYVNGTLQKTFATGSNQAFTFPIGGPDKYRPVALTNLTVTTAGTLAAVGTAGAHPNIATSGINPNRNVNWSWTLNDDGILVVGNYNPTFNFVAGDVDSGADPTQFVVRRFDGTNWSATATGVRTSTSTAATGLSVIGDDGSDFAVGDPQASQMIVTLPGQSFTSGSGNSGTAVAQTAGNAFNLTLSAVDIFNFIDTSYTGTQTISYNGPANAPNGAVPVYTTSVTFPNGQATGVATSLPKAQTTTITATDGVLTGVTSSNLTVGVAATRLVYTTVPVTGTAGTAFTVTIQTQDANGNPASPTSATTITLSKASGGGTLSGTLTGTISTSGNSVTISTPVYSKADTLTLTATATAGMTSLTPVTSGNIVFSAGAATKLAYASVPATATVGVPFSVTVQSQDANGNPANLASTTTITLSRATGTGTLSGTLAGSIASGTSSVTISTPIYSKAETMTLTATASGGVSLTSVTSGGIVFSANTPTKLVYTTVPGSGTAGTPFSVTVQSQDVNGNPANLTSTTTITLSKASGGGTLSGTLTGTIASGTNRVTISTPVYSKADTLTLTATATAGATSLTPVTSAGIPFLAATASKLVFITQPGGATVGSIFGIQPVVITQDAYGNNSVSGLASSVTVTLTVTSGSGPLKGTTNLDIGTAAGNGSVAFSNLQIDSAGSKQLTASAGGLTNAVSSIFSVAPASQTITFAALANKTFGDPPFALIGSASSGLPVNFSIISGPAIIVGTNLTITGAGTVTVSASQPGNANYLAASPVNQTFTVAKAASTLAVSTSANPSPTGSNVTFTATVSSGAGTPTGVVQFLADGTALGSPTALSGGIASLTTSSLTHGTHTIVAQYAGDGNFIGSTNSLNPDQVINSAPVAAPDQLQRYAVSGVKVRIATLLANDSDPDGDALTFVSVSPVSAAGGTVLVQGSWIDYEPPAGFTNADSYSYVMADSGGLLATGIVSIAILVVSAPSQNIGGIEALGNGSTLIHFNGNSRAQLFGSIHGKSSDHRPGNRWGRPRRMQLENLISPTRRPSIHHRAFTAPPIPDHENQKSSTPGILTNETAATQKRIENAPLRATTNPLRTP